MNRGKQLLVLVAVSISLSLVTAQAPEKWRGTIDLSSVAQGELEFFVVFTPGADGSFSATLSIPAQGAVDLPVGELVYTDERIEFTLAVQPPGQFRADRDGDEAKGVLSQGVELPISLRKVAAGEVTGPARPQTPHPPFPYEAREVSYSNPEDGTVLAGTLTIPEGSGPHPAALLITGSGSQDRDETIFGHKPFLVIADHLTRNGVAVLRVDDRGVGGSKGEVAGATSFDFAGDVRAGIEFLRLQSEIAADRIGLIGLSEGGLIAPIVAARNDRVAFIVLLAGPGLSGRELMPLQLAAIQRAGGRPEDNIRRQLEAQARMHDLVVSGAGEAELRVAVEALVDVQLETATPEQREAARDAAVATALRQIRTPWWQTFLATDPRQYLASVECPVLALNGRLDLQVPADPNLPAIEQALTEAGNDDVTARELENLNHLFQTAMTGSVAEYSRIEETFAPEALEIMTAWIRTRTRLD